MIFEFKISFMKELWHVSNFTETFIVNLTAFRGLTVRIYTVDFAGELPVMKLTSTRD